MNKAAIAITFALIVICTSYFGLEAQACTCGPEQTPYQTYQVARAVFTGKVLGFKDVPVNGENPDKAYVYYDRVFQFSVSESLKGTKARKIEINVGPTNNTCYQGFTIGESYLVYAFGRSDKDLGAGGCGRTTVLFAALDEVRYLHNLLKGIPEPRLYGSVMRIDDDLTKTASRRSTPVPGIKVLIEGEDKKFEAVTDANGLYSLASIPDGKYTARPQIPKKYKLRYPEKWEFILGSQQQTSWPLIQQGATAYAGFAIGWNNDLGVWIRDAEGNSIARAKLSLLLARSSPPLLIKQDQYDIRNKGKFWFWGVTPGRYVLAADIRAPFTDKEKLSTFYYPGVRTFNEAREIEIGEGEALADREIRLPPGYVVRQLEGVLVWPNGDPVKYGRVSLADLENVGEDYESFDSQSTDELGRFSLRAFVGAEYWVHGSSNSSGKGKPIKIRVQIINEPLRVVIPFPKPEPERDRD